MNIFQESDVLQDALQLFHVTHGFALPAPGSMWLFLINQPSTGMVFHKESERREIIVFLFVCFFFFTLCCLFLLFFTSDDRASKTVNLCRSFSPSSASLPTGVSSFPPPRPLPPNHSFLRSKLRAHRGGRVTTWRRVFQKMVAKVASNHSQGDAKTRKTLMVSF